MASYAQTLLPSVAAMSQKMEAPSQGNKRDDWRKAKELEEARKAGTAPALVDEEGKDINPHIPQYISTVPWYVGFDKPTLKHQRPQKAKKELSEIGEWYRKGIKEGSISTKFRKGACANCGSTTHKKKDCIERPRKVGAKFSGEAMAPDEHIQPNLSFDYDGKRDRWNGYNPEEHEAVLEEYAKMEEAKKHLKAKKLQNEMISGEVEREDRDADDSDDDEDKYADSFDMPGTNFDSKRRITVRNLRIREDTAKYLHNLRPNSAFYDPKTRSMRDNPYKEAGLGPDELKYAGDNFMRANGDTVGMATAQLFAWDASERGTNVHLQAEPTKLDLLHKEFGSKKDNFKKSQKETILEKYGGAEHLEAPPKQLLLAQTEEYVEYSRHGTIIKGQEKAKVKSKYVEDVYTNNHSSVWGSFWRDGQWGYHCCHSLVRGSYCTGQAGRMAATEDSVVMPPDAENRAEGQEGEGDQEEREESQEEPPKSLMEQHKEKLDTEKEKKREKRRKKKRKQKEKRKQKDKDKKKKKKRRKREESSDESDSTDSSSESEEEEEEDEEAARKKKIMEAMKRQEEMEKEADRLLAMDERKRPYNSLRSYDSVREPTEEEMEAYRMKRKREEDPMAQFLTKY